MRLTFSTAPPFVATLYALGIVAELRDGFGMPTSRQRRRIEQRFRLSARSVDNARAVLDGYALWRWVKVGCLRARTTASLHGALAQSLAIGAKPIATLLQTHPRTVAPHRAASLRRELQDRWRSHHPTIERWLQRAHLHPPAHLSCVIIPGLDDLGAAVPGIRPPAPRASPP